MHYTISLDTGTNSIGFTLLDNNNTLLELGVDTFPMGNKEEKGIEKSRSAERRGYRSARRNRFRYHLRRAQLKTFLQPLGMIPDWSEKITAFDLYRTRKEAVEQQITLQELGRILFLFNKYRGFKSSRKEVGKDPEKEKEEGAIQSEISWLKNRMSVHNCKTVGHYFFKMFEKSHELQQRGEWHNPDEPYDERGLDGAEKFSLVNSRGIRREGRHLERALIEAEFDLIWQKQRTFYPTILTDTNYHQIKNRCIFYQRPLKSPKKFIGKCSYEKSKPCAPLSSLPFQEFRLLKQLLDIRITDEKNPQMFNVPLDDEQRGMLFEELNNRKSLSFSDAKKLLQLPKNVKFNTDELGKDLIGNKTRAFLRQALGETLFQDIEQQGQLEKLWHVIYMHQDEAWLREKLAQKWKFSPDIIDTIIEIYLEEGYGSYSTTVLQKLLPELRKGVHERDALKKAGYEVEQNAANRPLKPRISELKNNELRNPVVEKATMRVIRLVNQLIKKYNINPEQLTIRVESTRELKKPKQERQKIRNQNLDTEKRRKEYAAFLTKYGKFGIVYPNSAVINKFELWLELGENQENLKDFQKFILDSKDFDLHFEKYRLWLEQGMKCPYTFKTIPLADLMSPEIEIEHIVPYSRSMDNSFVNKTLCFTEANKQKSNSTAFEFMRDKGPGTLIAFKEHIKKVFAKSPEKQKRFLQEEVPPSFRPDQLTNTSYIARQIRSKLQEVSRDVQFTTGAATSELRRIWRIGSLLEEVMYEETTGIEMWRHFANRTDENNRTEIENFKQWQAQFGKGKNRSDHRHHALDALVIGFCTPAIVQQISTFHRVREELKIANADHDGLLFSKELEYRLPRLPIQKSSIREALKRILVASQVNQRLLVAQQNHSKKKGGQHTQAVQSLRGALFKETFFGKIQKPHPNAFDKHEVFVTRKALTPELIKSSKDLEKIVDVQIREILKRRLAQYGDRGDKAFSEEEMRRNPVYMYSLNDYPDHSANPSSKKGNTLPVIKKVRTISKNVRSFVAIPAKDADGVIVASNRYAEKNENYIMAFYQLLTTNKKGKTKHVCDFKLLSTVEAVRKRQQGEPLFADELTNEKGETLPLNPLCPNLKKGDFVVFYEKTPDEIQWNDPEDLSKRLYQATGLSEGIPNKIYPSPYGYVSFAKHNHARYNASYERKEFSLGESMPFITMSHIQLKAVKVKVSQLGEVTPLSLSI